MTIEQWVSIVAKGVPLEVSNLIRIRTIDRRTEYFRNGVRHSASFKSKILCQWLAKNGYMTVSTKHNGRRIKFSVHRLIGQAFVPGYSEDLTINHINGNKVDNRIENLEWVSLSQNTHLQWETGLVNLRGENHPSSKLTAQKVRIIRECLKKGVSRNSLATLCGVSHRIISLIESGERWSSVS